MSKLDEIRARANNPFGTAVDGMGQLDADRDYLLAEVASLHAQIKRAQALHTMEHVDVPLWQSGYKSGGDRCALDDQSWPCETIAALTQTEPAK